MGDKELAKLPVRVQRFRLRMMAYSYKIHFTPGSKLVLADALSRAPVETPKRRTSICELVDSPLVRELVDSLPIAANLLERIKASMLEDRIAMALVRYIIEGWLPCQQLDPIVKSYFTFRDFLTYVGGVIFYMD